MVCSDLNCSRWTEEQHIEKMNSQCREVVAKILLDSWQNSLLLVYPSVNFNIFVELLSCGLQLLLKSVSQQRDRHKIISMKVNCSCINYAKGMSIETNLFL